MRPSTRYRLVAGGTAAIIVAAAAVAFGLSRGGGGTNGYEGTPIAPPIARPAAATGLTDTSGKPYSIASGKATLFYFGYTHCPDLCPTTMADVAEALTHVSAKVRADTQVVFVTVDPLDDPATRIRSWLDGFDSSFTGVTGPYADILKLGNSLSAGVATTEPKTTAEVQHGGQLVGLTPTGGEPVFWIPSVDNSYNGPTLQQQLEHDLPKLVAGSGG